MKKILLIIITGMALFSCKQERHTTAPSGKKYKVTFNVANFNQKQTPFSLSKQSINALSSDTITNLSSYFDVLYYAAFNRGRPQTDQPLIQDSTMANMGTITDSLPAGTYSLYFWAGKKGLTTANWGFEPDVTFSYNGSWQDTFWATAQVTVGTANVNKTIVLNRIIGKLQVKLLDNIPANADSLIISVHNDDSRMYMYQGSLGAESGDLPRNFGFKIPSAAKGHPNFIVERIIGNVGLTYNVIITCKTAANNVIGTATVNNVGSAANMTTILSGNLFTSNQPNSQTFNVKIDTAWNSTPIHTDF